MTTNDAVAAPRLHRRVALVVLTTLMGLNLSGCGTGDSLFTSSDPQTVAPAARAQPSPAQARVAIAPVIGAPDTVAKQLSAQLADAVEKQRVGVAKSPGDKVEYTLRGYIVAARDKAGVKVSYIWDVTDGAGKRVNRITGEELVAGAQGKDPWSAVTPQIMQTVADKTAASLGSWLPSQTQAAVAGQGPAGVGGQPPPDATTTASTTGAQPAAGRQQTAAASAASQATGSIARDGAINAVVPGVAGAPGDGSTSLTSALQRELARGGVALADRTAPNTYRVEGKVTVGEAKEGKQSVQIDWNVKDPQGKKLGTVSQKNEIPQGSLDGAWGQVADAAAAAAAQGILKLMPPAKSVN